MYKSNKLVLTWISFLSYALTGALVTVTGIVMSSIATYYKIPITGTSHTFTFLYSGILIAIFLNAWLMEIVPLKRQLVFGFLLFIAAIIGLVLTHDLKVFSLCLFVLGIVSGITMSIGTFLITYLYEGRRRGSRLLFTDSFFSMAAMIIPILVVTLLARGFTWYWAYIAIGAVYLIIFFLTLMAKFPSLTKKQNTPVAVEKEMWSLSVLFLSIAALCYILGQLGFINWVPQYTQKYLAMDQRDSGRLVSSFWAAYMVGMWVFSALLRYADLQRVVSLLSLISFLLIVWFVLCANPTLLHFVIIMLGFFSSAIYTTIITLGSQQTRVPSPKLVNFILTCGTVGTMLTFVVTGEVVSVYQERGALITAAGLYGVVFVMCFLTGFVSKHRQHER